MTPTGRNSVAVGRSGWGVDPVVSMTVGSTVSRMLGFVRAVLLVAALGATTASPGGQIFDVANTLPSAIYALVAGGALSAVLVPSVVAASQEGASGAHRLRSMMSLVILGGAFVTAAAVLAAPWLISVYAHGWPSDWTPLGVSMAWWCLPQLFFLVVATGYTQVLTARHHYTAAGWAPVLANVVTIAALAVFILGWNGAIPIDQWDTSMVALLCGGFSAGALAQCLLVVVVASRHGLAPTLTPSLRGLRASGQFAGWTLLGILAWQLSYIIVSNVCSAAGAELTTTQIDGAGLNTLSAAYLVFLLPQGILVVPLVTVAFTRLSHSWQARQRADIQKVWRTRTLALVVLLSAASGCMMVLAWPLCLALWDTTVAAPILCVLAPGLPAYGVIFFAQRVSMALGDAVSPCLVQVVIAINTVIGCGAVALLVPAEHSVLACAGALTVSSMFGSILSVLLIRRTSIRSRVPLVSRPQARTTSHALLGVFAVIGVCAAVSAAAAHLLPVDERVGAGAVCIIAGISALVTAAAILATAKNALARAVVESFRSRS